MLILTFYMSEFLRHNKMMKIFADRKNKRLLPHKSNLLWRPIAENEGFQSSLVIKISQSPTQCMQNMDTLILIRRIFCRITLQKSTEKIVRVWGHRSTVLPNAGVPAPALQSWIGFWAFLLLRCFPVVSFFITISWSNAVTGWWTSS